MKLFLDTADTVLINKYFASGLIDGITTNPTLIMKSGRDPWDVYKELDLMGLKDISMEVVGDTAEMVREGRKLSGGFGDTATIKVPCTEEGLKACYELTNFGIRVNVTLIFSVSQAILAVKAGARYLSPFVGRVDDQRFGGCNLIKRIREVLPVHICAQYNMPEILSAAIRSVGEVEHSFAQGADIVTMPPKIFEGMYKHVLTDVGVDIFEQDWQSVLEIKNFKPRGA